MKSDGQLQRDILDELDWEPRVDAAHIGVTVHEGIVTLTGHVPVYSQKHFAEQFVKRVHGVRAVANEIEVRPTGVHVRDDEDLAAAAVHALRWDVHVPEARVQVTVTDGWVTLEGTVEWPYQRTEAERVVRHLAGVRGVTNSVAISPRETTPAVQNELDAALQRCASLHQRKLSAVIEGTTVNLCGDVHSYTELEEAMRIAWSTPGVQDVQNCITVTPWGVGPAEEWGY